MLSFSLRSLRARRARSAMTALAVLLGVAMISGTFVFTDTINAAFHQLFTAQAKGAAVVVSSRQDIASAQAAPAQISSSLVTRIGQLPGVTAAAGQIIDTATVVARSGHAIKNAGPPALAISYLPAPFTGLTFLSGRPPSGPNEVILDEATAKSQRYRVGDVVSIVTGQPLRHFRLAGIATLGGASLGGASFAVFDPATASALYERQGTVDAAYVAAAPGFSPAALIREIQPLLPPELVARTPQSAVDSQVQRVAGQLRLLTVGLLVFALIAVFVGAFAIFNTFAITVAQRTGDFALLRALGASRRQVLTAVLVEAAALGLIASLAGLALGAAAALAIKTLFTAVGFNVPSTALVFQARTAIIGVGVGVLVTLVAASVPALRATRVAPLEALRTSEAPLAPTVRRVRLTAAAAAILAIGGLALIFVGGGTSTARLERSAAGAGVLVLALVAISPVVIGDLIDLAAWPLERGGRILGVLARENAVRNKGRTAVSASSLMIGVALVLFVTVYASGLRASTRSVIRQTFIGDFTIENQDGSSSIPASSARVVAGVPDVLAVSSLKTAVARLPGAGDVTTEGIDPTTISEVYRFKWVDGSPSILDDLSLKDAIVERDTARSADLKVGDQISITTSTGTRAAVTIRGIYSDRALLRGIAMPISAFAGIFHQPRLQAVFVKLNPGSDPVAAGAALGRALAAYPGVVARSETQLESQVAGRVNSILVLFYALLAMSVVVSLLGITNTLSLSIHERTRELGVLRALGMTSLQVRGLVRNESMITASIGAVVGLVLGIFLAWIVTRSLSGQGVLFSVPWAQVAGLLVLGLLAGVLASLPPAARAARLDVLTAIAHE